MRHDRSINNIQRSTWSLIKATQQWWTLSVRLNDYSSEELHLVGCFQLVQLTVFHHCRLAVVFTCLALSLILLRVPHVLTLHLCAAHELAPARLQLAQLLQIAQCLDRLLDRPWLMNVLPVFLLLRPLSLLFRPLLSHRTLIFVHLRKRYAPSPKSITKLLQLIFHTIQILVIYLLQFKLLLFKCILVVACLHIHLRWCILWIVRLVVKHRQCPVVQVFSVVWRSWQRLTIRDEWLHAWLACLVRCLTRFCVKILWCALVFYNRSLVFHVPHLHHWRVGLQ